MELQKSPPYAERMRQEAECVAEVTEEICRGDAPENVIRKTLAGLMKRDALAQVMLSNESSSRVQLLYTVSSAAGKNKGVRISPDDVKAAESILPPLAVQAASAVVSLSSDAQPSAVESPVKVAGPPPVVPAKRPRGRPKKHPSPLSPLPAGSKELPSPDEPTSTFPGSEDKLLVLIARHESGRELWHPEDKNDWENAMKRPDQVFAGIEIDGEEDDADDRGPPKDDLAEEEDR